MDKIQHLVKGLTLICWVMLLVYFSALVSSSKVSQLLENSTSHLDYLFERQNVNNKQVRVVGTGLSYLHEFTSFTPYPVLSATLNKTIPNWIDANTIFKNYKEANNYEDIVRSYYYTLFDVIDEHLIAIVQNNELDPERSSFNKDLVPIVFRVHMFQDNVSFPEISVNWIRNQRANDNQEKLKKQLIDTFFILLVLGAFGSLVFLIKDFLEKPESNNYVAYIFRPILGMFLAMAVFFLDMLAHSVISTSAIVELRVEPLYILGFAAGLLAEQAYEIIQSKAEKALYNVKKKNV